MHAEQAETVQDGKSKILVVDDRPDKLLVFETILAELGQTVITANSGEEALKLVLEHDFAVILLDVNMPVLDGLETAALIRGRKKSAHTPIIFITAYVDEMHATKGYSLGAVDYILSPVVPEILRTKVGVFVQLFQMAERAKLQAEERVLLAQEQAARAGAEEAGRRSQFLAEAGALLSGALDLKGRIATLAGQVLPALADLSAVVLIDEVSGNQQAHLAWLSDDKQLRMREIAVADLADSPLNRAIAQATASRERVVLSEPANPARASDSAGDEVEQLLRSLNAVAAFPLFARNRMSGVLCLGLLTTGRAFSEPDLQLSRDLAERAASAIDNAWLYGKVQESGRRKDEFLAMLAHELRNPLAPIQNAAKVLRLAAGDPDKSNWATAIIQRQVDHMVRLVDDLLDVSRITRGKIDLQLAPIEVSRVLSDAVEASRPLIESRRHRLQISLPREKLRIHADRARIEQVLTNLLNNAAKFTEEGGTIRVEVERDGSHVLCRVCDSGIGIASEMLDSIFDLFTQVAQPKSIQGSLGIGLTLARRLVEAHGGTVYATSKGLGQGSEFVVRLPALAEQDASAQVESASIPEVGGGLRVMVVDDDIDVSESTAELLRMQGCEVLAFTDGPSALKEFDRFQPDAVLLDISMPLMDGHEVARRMRAIQTGRRLLLIAASGYGKREDLERSRVAGFDAHLVKPVDPSVLLSRLTALFRSENASSAATPLRDASAR